MHSLDWSKEGIIMNPSGNFRLFNRLSVTLLAVEHDYIMNGLLTLGRLGSFLLVQVIRTKTSKII